MTEWNPGPKYRKLLAQAQEILENGERRTVRDVYYALEARGHDWNYRQVKRALKKGRRAGFIDPRQIIDATRPVEHSPDDGHEDPEAFVEQYLDALPDAYFENWWREQPKYVELWLEKQSLTDVFRPICQRYNVRLEATRGDWSDAKIYEATQRLIDRLDQGRDIRILYFGDYNPSGYHAPVAIQATMQAYGLDLRRDDEFECTDAEYFDIFPYKHLEYEDGGTLAFDRVAINTEHVERFDLPENPTPSTSDKDRRIRDGFMRHVSGGKDVNIELNALKEFEREFLESTIENRIREHVDLKAKQAAEARLEQRREAIRETSKTFQAALDDDTDV